MPEAAVADTPAQVPQLVQAEAKLKAAQARQVVEEMQAQLAALTVSAETER